MAKRSESEKKWCKRLLDKQNASGISQAELARRMSEKLRTRWRQSRVWKLLYAEMPVTVLMFEAAAASLGMTMDELTAEKRVGENSSDLRLSETEINLVQTLRMIGGTDHASTLLAKALNHYRREDGRAANGRKPSRTTQRRQAEPQQSLMKIG